MLKLMLDFVRYFLTSKNYLISSAFKFVFFSFGGLRPPNPPPGLRPWTPPATPASGSNYLLHDKRLFKQELITESFRLVMLSVYDI